MRGADAADEQGFVVARVNVFSADAVVIEDEAERATGDSDYGYSA